MNRYLLLSVIISVLWLPGYAQPRRLFEFEQREGDSRPKPDLTPTSPYPSPREPALRMTPRFETKGEGKRVGSKAPGWQPNGIAVCDTAAAALPRIVSDGKYGAIICWTECYRDQVNLDDDIYAQRVDSGGNFLWPSQGVPVCSLKGSYSNYPAMIADGKGGVIIAWEDSRGGLGYTRVFAQRLDSLGNRVWPENGVLVCNQMSGYVDLCSDGHGGAIIAYVDGRDQATTSDNIYAQRIGSAGNPAWAIDGVPVCTADSIQFWPHICSNGNGGAVITWEDDYRNNGTTGEDIYAQMLDSLGNVKMTLNGETMCAKTGLQKGGYPIVNKMGGGIISWWDFTSSNLLHIQSIDSNGIKQWADTGLIAGRYIEIIKDNRGGGIVGYGDSVNCIDNNGIIRWGTNTVLHSGLPSGGEFDMSEDGFSGVVAIWNYSTHLYSQRVDSNGIVLWETTGVPVCTTMNTNNYQEVIGDGIGGAIATWYGSPINGDNHIYAQRVNANGIPGGVTGEPVEENRPVKLFMNIFPNPSKGRTEVEFSLAKPAFVELAVYNMLGQRVRTLVNSYKNAGRHKISWNGSKAAAGVYFYRLEADEYCATKKVVLIK